MTAVSYRRYTRTPELRQLKRCMKNRFPLLLAEGFGVGRIPFAPGTFGSLVGLLWFALLLLPGNVWVFFAGALAGVGVSVRACGEAEKILDRKDPGCVVLDEIIAMPLCFVVWVAMSAGASGALPGLSFVFVQHWPWVLAGFVLFRVFDVLKPWPVFQSQSLPGGWGVTMDDVLAAGYVNLALAALHFAGAL